MRTLTPSVLLEVWERAIPASAAERPLLLLSAAEPKRSRTTWAKLSASARDARLIRLREAWFGSQLRSVLACPRCGEKVELNFSSADIKPAAQVPKTAAPLTIQAAGYSGRFRLPVSGDWVALAGGASATAPDPEALRDALASRCLLTLTDGEGRPWAGPPPREVLAAVAEAIAQHDADAHTELSVSCPACGYRWQALFDIASFLWREIEAYCLRLLQQVHRLAQAYCWTESEILRLSQTRRERYLAMIEHD